MIKLISNTVFLLAFTLPSLHVLAAEFTSGPVFENYGKKVLVDGIHFDKSTHFNVVFDVNKGAEPGQVNRYFDSLARFINMHVASGVPEENIHLALVVHGSATEDLLKNKAYNALHKSDNANIQLLEQLMQHRVKVVVCAQSAVAKGFEKENFIDGIEMALSAMTAKAELLQQGYTLNTF